MVIVIAPRAVTMLKAAPFMHGLRLVSPYLTVLVGTAWALVAWGLFRVRDWARFVAALFLGVGMAWEVTIFLGRMHFGWRIPLVCLELMLRGAAVWYLMSPAMIETLQQG
jgi:hypothetical protein